MLVLMGDEGEEVMGRSLVARGRHSFDALEGGR